MQRRTWKLDLIARIEERVHAAPSPAPELLRWGSISRADDEYRRVVVDGSWLKQPATLVRALTELGEGFWVMAALARHDGTIVLVNRGFVPTSRRWEAVWPPLEGPTTITGRLRMSEPGGTYLQPNDPPTERWYSRDVERIGEARGWSKLAPYFIDAERSTEGDELPVAGLTVLRFSNNHLIYALTWAVLAAMALAGALLVNLEAFRPELTRKWRRQQARAGRA